ncbi:hypothetical protein EJ02DRAFT_246812 [Clathrospora elynae]|uniref:Uncharacterized protein n=1 Tax=Clathrospora elynae TaxID=706981 RepID=A0A6A5SMH6_9PLEO|nr:hypothetical protein EJ02DRAFT_246812 [Clathrospora elynae]
MYWSSCGGGVISSGFAGFALRLKNREIRCYYHLLACFSYQHSSSLRVKRQTYDCGCSFNSIYSAYEGGESRIDEVIRRAVVSGMAPMHLMPKVRNRPRSHHRSLIPYREISQIQHPVQRHTLGSGIIVSLKACIHSLILYCLPLETRPSRRTIHKHSVHDLDY